MSTFWIVYWITVAIYFGVAPFSIPYSVSKYRKHHVNKQMQNWPQAKQNQYFTTVARLTEEAKFDEVFGANKPGWWIVVALSAVVSLIPVLNTVLLILQVVGIPVAIYYKRDPLTWMYK